MLRFLIEEQVDHLLRGDHAEFARVELPRLTQDLAQDVVAHGTRRFHLALALAGRARFAQHVRERFARALARHLDEPELREAVDRHARAVARQRLLQLGQHRVAMLGVLHVDEVDDDDPAEVAQPQLPRDRVRGLEVGLEDRVVEVARTDVTARVHVDRRHRLGLVDHQVAARLQVDTARQCALDLRLDVVQVEQRPFARVVVQLRAHGRRELGREFGQALVGLARIDLDARRVVVREIAQHALREIEILVQQARRWQPLRLPDDRRPCLAQVRDVAGEFVGGRILGDRAHDVAPFSSGGITAVSRARTASRSASLSIFCEMPICGSCGR